MERMDVVAKKAGFLTARMRNERFRFGEFQLEAIS
jgi:hypothetical protein